MINSLRTKVIDIPFEEISCVSTLLQPVDAVNENGGIVQKSEFRPFDFSEANLGIKSTDFCISNLVSVGALSKLKTTYMSHTSGLNVADGFESLNLEQNVPTT